jgi:hypothetical protein
MHVTILTKEFQLFLRLNDQAKLQVRKFLFNCQKKIAFLQNFDNKNLLHDIVEERNFPDQKSDAKEWRNEEKEEKKNNQNFSHDFFLFFTVMMQ